MLTVRTRRLELPHPKRILAPQASASTNSATCAKKKDKDKKKAKLCLTFVTRLGLEPRTPTLKVLCSTS